MATTRDLETYRRAVEEAVMALGRDDVGVGDVESAEPGVVTVRFSRGRHAHTARIPIAALDQREEAYAVIMAALLALNKRTSQEALAKAAR